MNNGTSFPKAQSFSQEPAAKQPAITLRTVLAVSLGAAAALAVDVAPLVHWVQSLV